MIEVENLTKMYGKHMALDHVSFQLEEGKIYGFLGPNGAGKSTTMNMMTGYIAPTDGTVRINGFDILKEAQEAKKCIGYLPELPPLYQDMTVEEFLYFVAEMKKLPKQERKTQMDEVMQLTGIADMAHRLIRNLSKGYKQRVGLAQAVLGYPDIIILDEPTVGLDPKQIIEIRELIRKLGEKHTVILSSHILSEVQAVCDEIMIISKGKMVARGTSEELITMMHKDVLLELEIEGARADVAALLGNLELIETYTVEESEHAGIVKAFVHTSVDVDIRRELFYALAQAKLPIMSLCRKEDSLEDVFLELTGEILKEDVVSGKAEGKTADDPEDEAAGEALQAAEQTQGGEEDAGNL